MKSKVLLVVIITSLVIPSCQKTKPSFQVCGTWRMVSGVYITPSMTVHSDGTNRISYKIFSGDHFSVVEMFKNNPDSLFFAAVGTYDLTDSTYTEKYQASNVVAKVGQQLKFKSQISEGVWRIQLKTVDMELDETWECVQKLPVK